MYKHMRVRVTFDSVINLSKSSLKDYFRMDEICLLQSKL
jgi:hypothetical protein